MLDETRPLERLHQHARSHGAVVLLNARCVGMGPAGPVEGGVLSSLMVVRPNPHGGTRFERLVTGQILASRQIAAGGRLDQLACELVDELSGGLQGQQQAA